VLLQDFKRAGTSRLLKGKGQGAVLAKEGQFNNSTKFYFIEVLTYLPTFLEISNFFLFLDKIFDIIICDIIQPLQFFDLIIHVLLN
jgi:hypothetical protein